MKHVDTARSSIPVVDHLRRKQVGKLIMKIQSHAMYIQNFIVVYNKIVTFLLDFFYVHIKD